MREKIIVALAVAAAGLLAYDLYQIFLVLPDEAMQGAIYRIIFFHVPAAITGMIGYFVALTLSILYLSSGKLRFDSVAASVIEVSVVFSVVNIVTGSIWARIIWGVWWTWDYRLTSQLVCILIFAGYLMMRRAIEEPTQRARLSAALCIFGCIDVVIVWKSIEWFRNLHPGPVLSIRTGGGNIDPAMERMIYFNLLAILMIAAALVLIRTRQETTAREIDSLRRLAHAA
ncbi:MAG: cytochrome c biogenesis protein CcsA [Acidobacteriaceae bacterium]|nr:cytochrome c biogenesis protein CcsA [Acidobacteriaceae bacterium]MBV9500630.1 cytochrome c biogenesis protein CcsA [Acidobacteriaceae bacterium]